MKYSAREKKILFIGAMLTFSYALFIFIAQPIYNKQNLLTQQIQDKIIFIQKYQEIINQKSYYQTKSTRNKSIKNTLNQRFFNEEKPALAAAAQQRLLEELARQTGVNIVRVRVDKSKYIDKLLSISSKITTRSTLRNLTRFIHMLENNQKFMIIEEISAQRANSTELEELQSQITISGFIKKMVHTEAKTI